MALRVYETLGETEEQYAHIEAAQSIHPVLFSINNRLLLRLIEDGDFAAAHNLADQMDFQGWTTQQDMRRVIDWVSDPAERPDDAMWKALEYLPKLALLAGQYDLWFEIVEGKDEQRRWENVLVTLSLLSSTSNEQQFVALHADPRAKQMINETGLPDYWRQVGWPSRCRPQGADDFVCE